MIIDLRQMVFATLWKKYEKKLNNETAKSEIRNGTATYKFADYGTIRLKDYTTSKYSEEDQAKIDKFIEENGIKKITETKENYSVEFVPSEKAIKEFDKMIKDLEQSEHKNIAKVAANVKNIM
jgi:hypothetical protein